MIFDRIMFAKQAYGLDMNLNRNFPPPIAIGYFGTNGSPIIVFHNRALTLMTQLFHISKCKQFKGSEGQSSEFTIKTV